jgi:P27 family predicted phage terminase small subunit
MALSVVEGAGLDVEEPGWDLLIPNAGKSKAGDNRPWRDLAASEWRRVTAAMRAAGTLAPENRHQIQRLVLAYVRYDRAAAQLFRSGGPVTKSKTGVPMLNQWQVEMRQADGDATTAEMELGIPPRRRAAAGKANRQQKKSSAADAYLKKVPV